MLKYPSSLKRMVKYAAKEPAGYDLAKAYRKQQKGIAVRTSVDLLKDDRNHRHIGKDRENRRKDRHLSAEIPRPNGSYKSGQGSENYVPECAAREKVCQQAADKEPGHCSSGKDRKYRKRLGKTHRLQAPWHLPRR